MKTIEELKAKHAAEIAEATRELAIAAKAVVTPERVHDFKGAPWLIYQVDSLSAALDILKAAPVVPFWRYKGTFTKLQPIALERDKDGEAVAGPFACSVRVSQGEGFGPDFRLSFYVMAGDELCQAHVTWGNGLYGQHSRFGAQANHDRDYKGRIIKRNWYANTTLSALSDDLIKWGTGSDTAAMFEYLWIADTVDGGADHALAQLENLGA